MLTVAIVGADGSGKSTVVSRLDDQLPLPHRRMYLGVSAVSATHPLPTTRAVRWTREALGRPPRHAGPPPLPNTAAVDAVGGGRAARLRDLRRAVLLAHRVVEESYQEAISRWHRSRGRIVVYDRFYPADYHAHDLRRHPDMRWDRQLHGRFLRRCFAPPDLVVVLDGTPALLHARKGEGTLAELASRRAEYLAYAQTVPRAVIVGVDQPLDDVVATVSSAIVSVAHDVHPKRAVRA